MVGDKPMTQLVDVEAERITVNVGNLTINCPGPLGYKAEILFDGKEPPFGIRGLKLTLAMDDAVRCELDTLVKTMNG